MTTALAAVGFLMAFTFFFRDLQVLETATEHVMPSLAGRSFPRVWDAGCAMGPESYSLAILFAEKMGPFAFNNLRIHSTDLDEDGTFGETVARGVYADQDLERVPPEIRRRYFEPSGKTGLSRVIERVRNCIRFQRHDLLSLLPVGTDFGLVVCKNVLLHFQAAQRIAVIRMFHAALAPGGCLAMEQTQKLPGELEPLFRRVVPDCQLFRKVEG